MILSEKSATFRDHALGEGSMKRGFLWGAVCSLIVLTLDAIQESLQGRAIAEAPFIFAIPAVLVVWLAVRRAIVTPPHKSRWAAFGGWILGFLGTPAIIGVAAAVVYVGYMIAAGQ